MAIQLPSEKQTVQLAKSPTQRISGTKAPQIDTRFAETLSQGFQASQKEKLGILKKLKTENDDYILKKKDIELQDKKIRAQAEVTDLRGEDVHALAPEIGKKFKDSVYETTSTLPEHLKKKGEILAQTSVLNYNSTAIAHTFNQDRKLKETTFNQHAKTKIDFAVEGASDTATFKSRLAGVTSSAEAAARLKTGYSDLTGTDAETFVSSAKINAASETILKAIELRSSIQGGKSARELFEDESLREVLNNNPANVVRAQKILDTADKKDSADIALDISEQAIKAHPGNLAAQRKFLVGASGGDADLLKSSLSMAMINDSINDEVKKESLDRRKEADLSLVFDTYSKKKPLDNEALSNIAPENISTAITMMEKLTSDGKITTHPSLANKYYNMFKNNRDKFVDVNFNAMSDVMSQADINRFNTMRVGAMKSGSKGKGFSSSVASGIVDKFLLARAIDDETGIANAHRVAVDMVQALQESDPNMQTIEVQKRISDALFNSDITKGEQFVETVDVTEYETGFIGFLQRQLPVFFEDVQERLIPTSRFDLGIENTRGADEPKASAPAPNKKVDFSKVDNSWREFIRRGVEKSGGKPLSIAAENARLEFYRSKGHDVSSPMGNR